MLEQDCAAYNIAYVAPAGMETEHETRKRRKMIRDQVKRAQLQLQPSLLNLQKSSVEIMLEQDCAAYNITYVAPAGMESRYQQRKRRKMLRDQVEHAQSQLKPSELSSFQKGIHSNIVVHEMMSRFSDGELHHTVQKCKVCQEVRPIFNETEPSSKFSAQNCKPLKMTNKWDFDLSKGICMRCDKNLSDIRKNKRATVPRFSGLFSSYETGDGESHNNMNFLKIPPYLKRLRLIERLMVRRVSTYMSIHTLKYGMLASKGHSISIPQDMKIYSKLPLLPAEVGVLVLRSGRTNSKLYLANRNYVQEALTGLVYGYPAGGLMSLDRVDDPQVYQQYTGRDHVDGTRLNGRFFEYCPYRCYYDVQIDYERLCSISTSDRIVDLPSIAINEENDIPDDGTAKDQYDTFDAEEEIASYSGIVCPFDIQDASELLKGKLKDMIDDDIPPTQYINAGKVAEFPFNNSKDREKPLSEMQVEYFWTMCYPHIFVNESCDITVKELCNLDYDEWVEHIYFATDNRVSSDPFLKFHLMNVGLKKKALDQGSFVMSQKVNDALISVDELKSRMDAGDESIARTIINFGSNLINTDAYWKARKVENQACNFYQLYRNSMLPVWFDTNSNAEHHWEPLHRLIIKYHSMVNNIDEETVKNEFFSDSRLRHKLLAENGHIVTNYFHARDMNYKNTILKELYDWTDIWVRDEFAKLRGQIHSHSIIWSKSHFAKVDEIMSNASTDVQEKARLLQSWLQTHNEDTDTLFSPSVVSMHPARGMWDDTGRWIPNKQKWCKPEGPCVVNPDSLKSSFNECSSDGEREQFQVDVVNKCMLHGCSGYCLRPVLKSKRGDSNEPPPLKCRFHFGYYDRNVKMSSGKDINMEPTITEGVNPRYEGPRDHPRMVQHVAVRPLSWLGNCDSSIIIHQNLLALNQYLTGYACKGAATTSELVSMFKAILGKSHSNSSLKSIAQKMMMKAVGCVDTPGATADYFNTGNKPVTSTRHFTRVGLSGYKVVSKNMSKNGVMMATKSTVLDKFLSKERRVKYGEDITLYEWACICTCATKNKCLAEHVPVFTGFPNYCTWPVIEEYARAQLMIFSPGSWHKPEDLLSVNGIAHNDFSSAFASFIDTPHCPVALHKVLSWAKEKYDAGKNTNSSQSDVSVQLSQSSTSSPKSDGIAIEISMGQQLMNDIAEQSNSFDDDDIPIEEDYVFDNGGPGYDWHAAGLQSILEYASMETVQRCKTWLNDVKKKLENQPYEDVGNITLDLPATKPLLVNEKQMYAVFLSISSLFQKVNNDDASSHTLHRLIIQGSAGTGKSQIIKVVTRLGLRICQKQKSVLNLAPTGAAAVILPNGRTIHSIANIPRNNEDSNHTVTFSDKPLNAQQMMKLKGVVGNEDGKLGLGVLNLDERGMVGQNLFGWTNARFVAVCRALSASDMEDEANDEILPFGQVPVVNLSGDIFQLSPIGDKDAYKIPGSNGTPMQWYGHMAYMQFRQCIVLDEIMRQKPSQIKFINCLNNIREGTIQKTDWQQLNERTLGNLSFEERQLFEQDDTILLTETWAESYHQNCQRISSLNHPVAQFTSSGRGYHNSKENDMGQIRKTCTLTKGCRVMITKNQQTLAARGLNNGAVGRVVDIYYDEGMRPPHPPSFVILDIPGYRGIPGNECIPGYPSYVAMTVDTSFCENKCKCQRTGYPLIPAYGITITKSQGMTIGQNEMIKRCIIKLNDKISMESKCLGLAYTAFSRVCEFTDFALLDRIPWERLEYINHHKQMKSRKEEEIRLRQLESETLKSLQCSTQDYINLLEAVDEFCQDGIVDSICTDVSGNCSCIFHSI